MLKNKVAIITGGSRGIGKAIALEMARNHADVIINYHSDSSKLLAAKVIKKIEAIGQKALAVKCNVADFVQSKKIIDQAMKHFGKVDILVNNAGITDDALLLMMSEKQFNSVIDVNLKGVFHLLKHTSKIMLKQRSGSIINISSIVGIVGNPGQINYAAAKAGVIGMTKTVARELGKRNIRCNAIAPGFIKTTMTDKLPDAIKDQIKKQVQLGDIGKPEDVAYCAVFLASEKSSYITGQVINVDGGMVI